MRSLKTSTALTGILTATAAWLGGTAEAACVSSHLLARLDAFDVPADLQSFYVRSENVSPAPFRVINIGDDCVGNVLSVSYSTKDITATGNVDYVPVSGQTPPLNDEAHPDDNAAAPQTFHDVNVPIMDDSDVSVVESAQISLSAPVGGALVEPSVAALYIVDDDGSTSRIGFDSYPYVQTESRPEVRIPVFRAGDAASAATVSYSFAPGALNAAMPGEDFIGMSGNVSFQPGVRWALIPFTIVNDGAAEPSETLEIRVEGAGVVAAASKATFTIVDNEEAIAPRSKLHHPRHRWRYRYNDYRVREIHVFTRDEPGGSGVARADLALRRQFTNGRCAWWNGKRFRGGDCSKPLWRPMKVYEQGYFYYVRIKALPSSVGSRIKNYTALARSTDGAGNVETLLQPKRNRNTFEVKMRKS